ncbi:MAG: glycine betaine ABC transporter substrate-binding protein [Actinobacteria bacterium]|nr:glycine betaine ABC transporter substrate-binding protein [Actinomycetota bacterium]
MRPRATTRTRYAALAAILALLLAACGGGGGSESADGGGSEAGSESAALAEQVDLSGVDITVGSKEFTEQLILGNITKLALEAAGANVNDQIGLQGSAVVREALTSDQIDTYWEYTGTGWITHLGETEAKEGEEAQFEAVKEADAENDITWFAVAPMNNTYALAVKEGGPDISKLSEVEGMTSGGDNPGLCAASEFLNRDDGLPGLEEAYGFDFEDITEVELGLIYTQIGSDCTFGEVFATDGRIAAQNLKVLEDDENFFPKYNAALTMRSEVFDENSEQYQQLFGPIAEKLTNDQMIELNKRVDVDGEDPADVAQQFLVDNGFISG